MIYGNQFATESGRTRKLQPRWRGPFTVIEYDDYTQNYTVSMDSRIYRRQKGIFHYSVVKPYHPNDDQQFPGRAHAKPAPILVNQQNEWDVEVIMNHRERYGRGLFLVKWKRYPNSENRWEPLEGLENATDLVQAWWTDNMPGEEFATVFLVILRFVFLLLGMVLSSTPRSLRWTRDSVNPIWTLIMIAKIEFSLFMIWKSGFHFVFGV